MLYVQVDHVEPTASQGSNIQNSLVAQFDIWINVSLGENRTALMERTTPYRDRDFRGPSLSLTIEVNCGEHFYGPDCTKQCEPRDDERGHYMCDNGGNIICLEGFQNEASNCTECSLSNTCCEYSTCSTSNNCPCCVATVYVYQLRWDQVYEWLLRNTKHVSNYVSHIITIMDNVVVSIQIQQAYASHIKSYSCFCVHTHALICSLSFGRWLLHRHSQLCLS